MKGESMENHRFNIYPPAPRPKYDVHEIFNDLGVADICDALGRNAALPAAIRPMTSSRLLGHAYTVNLPAGENLLFYYAVANARAGDVIVIAGAAYEDRALCGEVMAAQAMRRGIAGFVVDGAVRDVAALRIMEFPVYARAVSPNGPYKDACGEINVPVSIGNVVISPGDIIIGDADGLVAVRQYEVEAVVLQASIIRNSALDKLETIKRIGMPDYGWLYDKLGELGCQFHTTPRE